MLGILSAADGKAFRVINLRLRARRFDPIMIAATDAGTKSATWLASALILAALGKRRDRRAAVVTAGATLSAQALVNVGIKPLVRRKRPFEKKTLAARLLVSPPREHSWPSGHAASSAAAVTALVAAYPGQTVPLLALGLTISYSRIYVGVHYPSDVASGTVIGTVVGGLWILLSRRWLRRGHTDVDS